jgi:DNA-binding XRE family transcriptional regulator
MDKWELLKWRRTLCYTQTEAGEKLGVNRGTIQNWERGNTRVPKSIELACRELTRVAAEAGRHDDGYVDNADGHDGGIGGYYLIILIFACSGLRHRSSICAPRVGKCEPRQRSFG